MLISFDDAPEHVKRLAFAIAESIGPTGIPQISPWAALACGRNVGLDAGAYVAAIRWIAKLYESRIAEGGNKRLAKNVAAGFEAFAVALEAEAIRASAFTASTTPNSVDEN